MTRIELVPAVLDDFERIVAHLAGFGQPAPLDRIEEIVSSLELLTHSPRIGRPVGSAGLRELVIGKASRGYVALYRHVPGVDTVFILAVRAQREDGHRG